MVVVAGVASLLLVICAVKVGFSGGQGHAEVDSTRATNLAHGRRVPATSMNAKDHEECPGVHEEESKCWGTKVDYDTEDQEITAGARTFFWVVFALVVVGPFVGFHLQERRKPESKHYVPENQRWFPMTHELPLLDAYGKVFHNAVMIVVAMLWSSFFASAFTALYWAVKGAGDVPEAEACPDRVGSYSCGYGEEEEELIWAIVLPAFCGAIFTVMVVLWAAAKCFERYWVEVVAGICGHLVGFRWLDGIIKKLYQSTKFTEYFKEFGQQGQSWVAYNLLDDIPGGAR